MILTLLGLMLSTLVSEDAACLAAGILVARGDATFAEAVAACLAGIFAGDLLLFLAGRLLGPSLLGARWARRWLSPEAVAEAREWLARQGLVAVLLSRFTPGLRLPTYFAAGLLGLPAWRFAAALLLASAVWTPLVVWAASRAGQGLVGASLHRWEAALLTIPALFCLLCLARYSFRLATDWKARRQCVGAWRRLTQWEFWPTWAAYTPLVPYFIYLAVKHRSLTLFTAANPGIPSGGLTGESKAAILRHLAKRARTVPEFVLLDHFDRRAQARTFLAAYGDPYPVVAKPDVGERGQGVAILRDDSQLDNHLEKNPSLTILQRYAPGLEFGVFYYRFPGQSHGCVLSITQKHFPALAGDGRSMVEQLILNDSRAVCLAEVYRKVSPLDMRYIPRRGESITLAEIGSHCRGAIFEDASYLISEELTSVLDEIVDHHEGFHLGRFDVRAPSREALRAGQSIQVLELNGVAGEATHIYDPRVSIRAAYQSLMTQWRLAFEIGAANRARGHDPMPFADLIAIVRNRFSSPGASSPGPVAQQAHAVKLSC